MPHINPNLSLDIFTGDIQPRNSSGQPLPHLSHSLHPYFNGYLPQLPAYVEQFNQPFHDIVLTFLK